MQRTLILVVALGVSAVCVSSALATVRVTKRSGPVSPGDTASVRVVVSPRARCTFRLVYGITRSETDGPGAKTAATVTDYDQLAARLTWKWTVGSNTKRGTWPVKIDCGESGKAQTTVTVS